MKKTSSRLKMLRVYSATPQADGEGTDRGLNQNLLVQRGFGLREEPVYRAHVIITGFRSLRLTIKWLSTQNQC